MLNSSSCASYVYFMSHLVDVKFVFTIVSCVNRRNEMSFRDRISVLGQAITIPAGSLGSITHHQCLFQSVFKLNV